MNDITEEVTILNTANHNGGGNPHNQYVLNRPFETSTVGLTSKDYYIKIAEFYIFKKGNYSDFSCILEFTNTREPLFRRCELFLQYRWNGTSNLTVSMDPKTSYNIDINEFEFRVSEDSLYYQTIVLYYKVRSTGEVVGYKVSNFQNYKCDYQLFEEEFISIYNLINSVGEINIQKVVLNEVYTRQISILSELSGNLELSVNNIEKELNINAIIEIGNCSRVSDIVICYLPYFLKTDKIFIVPVEYSNGDFGFAYIIFYSESHAVVIKNFDKKVSLPSEVKSIFLSDLRIAITDKK